MTDKPHTHLEHRRDADCPGCTQLAFDFATIRSGPLPIGAIRDAGRAARGELDVVTYAVDGTTDAHVHAALERKRERQQQPA